MSGITPARLVSPRVVLIVASEAKPAGFDSELHVSVPKPRAARAALELLTELEDQAARAKQYEGCSTQANTSPEMMAVVQKSANAYDSVKTQDDMIKVAALIAAERDEVLARKCGQAPARPSASDERLTDIMRKAAADAGPIE